MTRTFRFSVWLYLGLALLAFPAALSEGNAESLPESQEQGDGHVRRLQESEPEDVNEKAAAEGETPSDEPNDVLEETDEQDEDGGSSEDEEEQFYFYFDLPDTPIIEYVLAPEENVWAHHEFLLKPDPNSHRIVEFYAHWCPHCLHIKDQYIDFARKVRDVAAHYHVPVQVYAVACVPFRPVCQRFGVRGYPKIFLIRQNETAHETLEHHELHPYAALTRIGVELDMDMEETEEENVTPDSVETPAKGGPPGDNFFLPRKKKDIFNDAYLSFHFAMKNGIFKSPGPLTNETQDIFTDFIDMVQATMPPAFKLRRLATEIFNNIDDIAQSEESLIALVDQYPPKKKTWSLSCTRGIPSMGYTCGLWELFHIMTIGLVEYNAMLGAEDDYPYYRPADGGAVIRDFVEHFFDCEVCRTHFLASYDACAYEGCKRLTSYVGEVIEWIELPMWLFEFHNGVNVRLMKERAEREGWTPTLQDEINVHWPSRKDCPSCWRDDGRWEAGNVYLFLRLTYWPDDVFTENMKKDLQASELALKRKKQSFTGRLLAVILLVLMVVAGGYLYQKSRRLRTMDKVKKDP